MAPGGLAYRQWACPDMLRDRFDFILGNPPWLSYRHIADPDYQAEIKKRAIEDYAIAPKHQKLFTQMELATIFLMHSFRHLPTQAANSHL
jgi:methylase of polypeptide subunit release factors